MCTVSPPGHHKLWVNKPSRNARPAARGVKRVEKVKRKKALEKGRYHQQLRSMCLIIQIGQESSRSSASAGMRKALPKKRELLLENLAALMATNGATWSDGERIGIDQQLRCVRKSTGPSRVTWISGPTINDKCMDESFEFPSISRQEPQARARVRMLVRARNSRSAISASVMLSKAGP